MTTIPSSQPVWSPPPLCPAAQEDSSWAVIKPDVFAAIMDHFSSGEPMIMDQEALAKSDTVIHPEDDEVSHALLMAVAQSDNRAWHHLVGPGTS